MFLELTKLRVSEIVIFVFTNEGLIVYNICGKAGSDLVVTWLVRGDIC